MIPICDGQDTRVRTCPGYGVGVARDGRRHGDRGGTESGGRLTVWAKVTTRRRARGADDKHSGHDVRFARFF
jgi:hypothetical protein